jgi:ABC-2 type transport system permease protein
VAEVAAGPGLRQQVLLVAGLRWRLFRNGMRSLTAKLSLAGTIFVGVLWGAVGLGVSIGVGVGSYFLITEGYAKYLTAILWGIFVFWQFFPILSAQFAPSFDSTSLLRFPLKFSAFVTLNLAYGLADPAALCGVAWHLAMWIGIAIARPDLWWSAGIILLLSMAMNLLFSRMLYAWLERFLAQRRTREILFALFILVMISFQFTGTIMARWAKPIAAFGHRTSSIWSTLPPGQVGAGIQSFLAGMNSSAFLSCLFVCIYAAAFGALLFYRLHAEYLGELFSETAAPARVTKKAASARPVAAPPIEHAHPAHPSLIPGTVEAVFLKEVRYLYRNSIAALNLFLPLIIVGAMSLNTRAISTNHPGRHGGGGLAKFFTSNLAYPGAVAYALLILMQFSMNSLAYEGGGVQLLYVLPVKFRTIMLGKNLFQVAVLALEALMCWGLIIAISGPPPLIILLCTWTGLAFVALINMAAGNYLSLRFPRKVEFGARMRARGTSGVASLAMFVLYGGCLGLLAGVAALVRFLAGVWFIPLAFAVLCVAAAAVYLQLLNETSLQAVTQREILIEQLVAK